jgi:sugar lactone lactonase YvrE
VPRERAEARPHGRLLSYNPASGETKVLLKDLYFANGVALSANEDFVLVNETYRYRITRYWLSGDKAGTHDIFIDNLPGLPDNLQGDRHKHYSHAVKPVLGGGERHEARE